MYKNSVTLLRKKYDKAPMVMEAADAIEELSKQIKNWEEALKNALDAAPGAAEGGSMSVWYPCIYCTEDLKCTKNNGDGVISFCVLGPCHDETPSNADRIRAMSDEELAEMHVGVGCPPGTGLNELCFDENGEELLCTPPRCRECWLEWLRQEAHDEP